ncbi:MAG: chemotaxis protein [Beggiatoa sp. IS2]|nr:MAG: chemotaxis protein [Beggiatoa sp. IS2]
MFTYLITIGIILLLAVGWVMVQHLYRSFALRHPEFGPPRDEGERCGSCSCGGETSCNNKDESLKT